MNKFSRLGRSFQRMLLAAACVGAAFACGAGAARRRAAHQSGGPEWKPGAEGVLPDDLP